MMLTLTSPVDTWAHALPASAKLVALCGFGVVLFALRQPLPLLAACALVAGLTLSCGPAFAATSARMLRPLWPFVVIVTLWHLWLQDYITGASVLLRLFAAVAAANFVTMTTRLTDMIAVITRVTRPLTRLGLQPHLLALAFALVIRFIPVMLIKADLISQAFAARSPRRPGWRVLVPILLAALDDASHVAEALRARGGAG